MKRRGFLGALLGAPVMANAASAGLTSPNALGVAGQLGYGSINGPDDWGTSPGVGNPLSAIASINKDLEALAGKRPKMLANAKRHIQRLDADLADNRSFSLATKIRLQAERNVDLDIASERGWMQERIQQLLGLSP